MRKERQLVRNYEWAGSTSLCLAVQSALLRALSRGCCSSTDKTGKSCSICLHRPPDDPNYTASHRGGRTLVFPLGQIGQS
ncbi:hypothetical protein EPR50_G00075920 [Perca flavescens]|uniref:Uncharacterized protein n=1 Tax=Perca flavescens TaxID=8167 RepID=A0A484D791_PERFV|nr:hypothetical protein EPR50_G00075920 [Perca flavescens]